MEHGLKDIAFCVQKHVTHCTVVITSLLVRDKPLGAPASVKQVYWTTVGFMDSAPLSCWIYFMKYGNEMAISDQWFPSQRAGNAESVAMSWNQHQDTGRAQRSLDSQRMPVICLNSSPPQCRKYASVIQISIGSENDLSPIRRQAIRTNAGLLSIGPLGTNFSEIWIEIQNFSFMKMHLKCHLQNGGHFVQGEMS